MTRKKDNNPYRFYVYVHRRKDNNEVFYVGKGSGSRATSKSGRSDYWNRVVNKYGYYVEYVEKSLSEQDAFDLEIELIKFYRECGHHLCNLTDGGEGSSGYRHPPEVQEKINKKLRSQEFKEFLKKIIGRPVLCSNGMTFQTCKDAEIWLGNAPSSSKVSTCCRRERVAHGGFVWRFLDDSEDLQELIEQGKDAFVEWRCQEKLEAGKPKTVYCSNGKVFSSVSAVLRWFHSIGETSVRLTDISACCNLRKKKLRGLEFSFENRFSIPPVILPVDWLRYRLRPSEDASTE